MTKTEPTKKIEGQEKILGLRKERGIRVLSSDEPLSKEDVNQTIEAIRHERERSFLGNLKN